MCECSDGGFVLEGFKKCGEIMGRGDEILRENIMHVVNLMKDIL